MMQQSSKTRWRHDGRRGFKDAEAQRLDAQAAERLA